MATEIVQRSGKVETFDTPRTLKGKFTFKVLPLPHDNLNPERPFENITISLDMDDVMCGYSDGLKTLSLQLGLLSPEGNYPDGRVSEWFESREDFSRTHSAAVRAGLFRKVQPLPGLKNSLKTLRRKGAKIIVVTARANPSSDLDEPNAFEDTRWWHAAHATGISDIRHKHPKQQPDVHLHVDDSPHEIAELKNSGHRVVIFNQPWNYGMEGLRIYTWEDTDFVVDTFRKALFEN